MQSPVKVIWIVGSMLGYKRHSCIKFKIVQTDFCCHKHDPKKHHGLEFKRFCGVKHVSDGKIDNKMVI